jgi:hypothetical protein
VIFALYPAVETRLIQAKSSGWFSIFPALLAAWILSIPMESMDCFLSYLVSPASGA